MIRTLDTAILLRAIPASDRRRPSVAPRAIAPHRRPLTGTHGDGNRSDAPMTQSENSSTVSPQTFGEVSAPSAWVREDDHEIIAPRRAHRIVRAPWTA